MAEKKALLPVRASEQLRGTIASANAEADKKELGILARLADAFDAVEQTIWRKQPELVSRIASIKRVRRWLESLAEVKSELNAIIESTAVMSDNDNAFKAEMSEFATLCIQACNLLAFLPTRLSDCTPEMAEQRSRRITVGRGIREQLKAAQDRINADEQTFALVTLAEMMHKRASVSGCSSAALEFCDKLNAARIQISTPAAVTVAALPSGGNPPEDLARIRAAIIPEAKTESDEAQDETPWDAAIRRANGK